MSFYIGKEVMWMRCPSGRGWELKAPWMPPVFSERMGYKKPVIQLAGFRLFRLEAI